MADRWALAPAEDGGVDVAPLGPDGLPAGPVRREADPGRGRAEPSGCRAVGVAMPTAKYYPAACSPAVGERCYDIETAETLLLGHEGRYGEPRSAAAALGPAARRPVPPDPPQRSAEPGSQSSLFEPQGVLPLPDLPVHIAGLFQPGPRIAWMRSRRCTTVLMCTCSSSLAQLAAAEVGGQGADQLGAAPVVVVQQRAEGGPDEALHVVVLAQQHAEEAQFARAAPGAPAAEHL
ncbi:hypothetical protein SBADM41S_08734 [Streptomyces badius]